MKWSEMNNLNRKKKWFMGIIWDSPMGILSEDTGFTRTSRSTRKTELKIIKEVLGVITNMGPRLMDERVDDRRRIRDIGGGPAKLGANSIMRARCWSDTNWFLYLAWTRSPLNRPSIQATPGARLLPSHLPSIHDSPSSSSLIPPPPTPPSGSPWCFSVKFQPPFVLKG